MRVKSNDDGVETARQWSAGMLAGHRIGHDHVQAGIGQFLAHAIGANAENGANFRRVPAQMLDGRRGGGHDLLLRRCDAHRAKALDVAGTGDHRVVRGEADGDALGGRTFAKSTLEWNLPPLLFERVGTPGFYLAWARPSVFGTGLVTDFDDDFYADNAQSLGLQVDLRFQVMHRLDMTLSAGYARGYRDKVFADDEVMVSLKIL